MTVREQVIAKVLSHHPEALATYIQLLSARQEYRTWQGMFGTRDKMLQLEAEFAAEVDAILGMYR